MAELIDEEFGEWMTTIQAEGFVGDGAWGESFVAPVAVQGTVAVQNRTVITSDGKSIVSSTQIACGLRYRNALNEGARVVLPDDPRQYRVVQVRTWSGPDAHLEVDLV